MKSLLLLAAFVFPSLPSEPWPVGARAEDYLAKQTGLRRTADPPLYPARNRLGDLLSGCALPPGLAPTSSLGLHYRAEAGWGGAAVYAYTFTRPTALDSAYQLLSARLSACATAAVCRCQSANPQYPLRNLYVARSQYYLLLFDGGELSHDLKEFIPLADVYADLLD